MSYKPKTLFRILEDIQQNNLLLPHIQRPFVWEEDQMIKLFDSLMRNYPIQTLLFWRTKEAIKARKFMNNIERDVELSELYEPAKSVAGVEKVFVLDGQQRIQTLYAIFLVVLQHQMDKKQKLILMPLKAELRLMVATYFTN